MFTLYDILFYLKRGMNKEALWLMGTGPRRFLISRRAYDAAFTLAAARFTARIDKTPS